MVSGSLNACDNMAHHLIESEGANEEGDNEAGDNEAGGNEGGDTEDEDGEEENSEMDLDGFVGSDVASD